MAKKKTKEKSIPTLYIIPALILMVVVGATMAKYGSQLISDSKDQVLKSYETTAYNVSCQYEREIYVIEEVATVLADQLNEEEDIFVEDLAGKLNAITDNLSASNVYIVKPEYSAIDAKGNKYEAITDLPGYAEAFKGMNTVTDFIVNADGEQVMLVCVPINTKLEMKGYVLMEYKPNVMKKLLQQVKFSPQNSYALVATDGTIIETAGIKSNVLVSGENIFDTAGNNFSVGSKAVFKQSVQVQRTDKFAVTNNGTTEYLFTAPIAEYKAMVVVGAYEKYVLSGITKASQNIRSMLVSIGVIIGAFLIIIIGIALFSKAKFNMESEDLQNKADTDQLTDLYNKMATERMIREYLDGDGADKVSMLFLLDVDNFKKINDTMGHAFGDEVLMNLGHQIRAWFRVNDIVGRIGGDEFMVFIKDIKDESVVKREGSRIMQFFEGFQVGDYTKYSPTASIGGAVYPNDAKDFNSLYKAADKAVYKAKKEGKNRVAFYGDLNAQEQETEPDKTGRD